MGMYASGKRNSNGEHLLNFLVYKKLFACNTSFQLPVWHITNRSGYIKDYTAPRNSHWTIPYYSQTIFYVAIVTRNFLSILEVTEALTSSLITKLS